MLHGHADQLAQALRWFRDNMPYTKSAETYMAFAREALHPHDERGA